MTWYVVGSKALSRPRFNLDWREAKDVDIWTSNTEIVEDLKKVKYFDVKLIPQHIIDLMTFDDTCATPDTVYTIKCSHLGWNNPAWDKHKSDILHLKSKGCVLDLKLYNSLVSFWKTELGDKGFLSLKQDKENFFTDNVNYVYDHDYLHELVAHPEKPVYTKCLKQGEEVLIDKSLFDKLSFEEQVKMFREEITVIAIERFLVNPNTKGKYSWVQAYMMSIKKTITQLTKNWATDFIVLNLEHFVKPNYSMFKHALKQTNVK